MNSTVNILTSVSLILGLLIFAWRLFKKLNEFTELPKIVKGMTEELAKVNRESQEWRKESSDWHKQHIRLEHKRHE